MEGCAQDHKVVTEHFRNIILVVVSNGIFQFSMDFSAQGLVTVGTRAESGPELQGGPGHRL